MSTRSIERPAGRVRSRGLPLTALALALGVCGAGGLVERVPIKPEAGAVWDVLTVAASTQGESGDLRIGLGSVTRGGYTDGNGARRRGLVAGLWIFVRGDSSKNRTVELHAGQRLKVGRRTLYVEEIRGGRRGSVRVLVSAASA